MDWFRSVLIQDAPFIRQLEPDLFVWKHPVFSTSTFLAFEARVLAEAQSAEARMSEDARQLIPELSDYLSTNFTALFKATYNINTTLQGLTASFANNSQLIQEERRAAKYDALPNGLERHSMQWLAVTTVTAFYLDLMSSMVSQMVIDGVNVD